MAEEKDFRKGELLGKYTAKILDRQNDGKFEEVRKKLVKVEVSFSGGETLKRE